MSSFASDGACDPSKVPSSPIDGMLLGFVGVAVLSGLVAVSFLLMASLSVTGVGAFVM